MLLLQGLGVRQLLALLSDTFFGVLLGALAAADDGWRAEDVDASGAMARLLEDDSLTFEPIGIPSPQGAEDFGLDENDLSDLMGDIFGVGDAV